VIVLDRSTVPAALHHILDEFEVVITIA